MNLHLVFIYCFGVQLAVCEFEVESARKPLFVLKAFGSGSVFLMRCLEASLLPLGSRSTSNFGLKSQSFIK